jgi:hypothetical protein
MGQVGLSRAIELLAALGDSISLSTLSRYVQKYADALSPAKQGRKTIVDFEALLEHRTQNIHMGALSSPPSELKPGAAAPFRAAHGRADMAALNIRAQWQMRELDLAERAGALTPTCEVKEGAISAIQALKSAFALALNSTADAMGNELGVEPRLVRPRLRAFERIGMDAFVLSLADSLAWDALGDEAEGETEDDRRVREVTSIIVDGLAHHSWGFTTIDARVHVLSVARQIARHVISVFERSGKLKSSA